MDEIRRLQMRENLGPRRIVYCVLSRCHSSDRNVKIRLHTSSRMSRGSSSTNLKRAPFRSAFLPCLRARARSTLAPWDGVGSASLVLFDLRKVGWSVSVDILRSLCVGLLRWKDVCWEFEIKERVRAVTRGLNIEGSESAGTDHEFE